MSASIPIVLAWAAPLRGAKEGLYRGVIDETVDRGTYVSGNRLWRCHHEHRSHEAAVRCAEAEQRRRDR